MARKLADLPVKTPSFPAALPPDEVTPTPHSLQDVPEELLRHMRAVRGLYTYIKPDPPDGKPKLLSVSKQVSELIGLDYNSVTGPDKEEFTDVMSGVKVVKGTTGWAQCYGGHQFGHWAGQLGDGRAITLFETQTPSGRWEVQLKGAGQTPYSRFADGRAVLRSSIREYLGCEAVHALGIPTTRVLSLVSVPEMLIHRETLEPGAVISRLAPTWIRFGTFELLDVRRSRGPFFKLAEYTAMHVFGLSDEVKATNGVDGSNRHSLPSDANIYERMLAQIARNTAEMIAGWQAYGYMNGVMNTDNMHIQGLTLDYGPFAFMDDFDFNHICNHTDTEGRYSYRRQPDIALWNFAKLGLTRFMSELVGTDSSDLNTDWFQKGEYDESKRDEAMKKGQARAYEIHLQFNKWYEAKYADLMRKRLGLVKAHDDDIKNIIEPLLQIMQDIELDFHKTFRQLTIFRRELIKDIPSVVVDFDDERYTAIREFIQPLMPKKFYDTLKDEAKDRWISWLRKFAERIEEDGISDEERIAASQKVNPVFVLRQWVLEEVIERVTNGEDNLVDKVLTMCEDPYQDWTKSSDNDERKFCDIGPEDLRGFKCSCSS